MSRNDKGGRAVYGGPAKTGRKASLEKGEQTERGNHPVDGSLDRLCDPPGRVFSDSESRTVTKSAQENPVSVRADEKILKAQSSATTGKRKSTATDQKYHLQKVINA